MKPSKIVIATWGSLGDLFPYLAIARELKQRGHHPIICTTPYHQERIEAAGIGFHPTAPHVDITDKGLYKAVMHDRNGPRILLREILFAQIRQSYEDLLAATRGADLLVTQMVAYAGPIVAEKTGIPWISTVLAPQTFFSYTDAPVLAAPLTGLRVRFPRLHAAINRTARWTTRNWGEPVRQLRQELGLSRGREPIFEALHSPARVLALFSRELAELQPDWPPNTQVTGFVFNHEPPLPPEVEAFLDAGDPPIVFTLGSSAVHDPGDFYGQSIQAVRGLKRRAVLLGAPPVNAQDILCVDYAPHGRLFERAAAIVHQGGIGTLARAMAAGHPMLIVPWAYDQPDNAARMVRKGIALTLSRKGFNAARAKQALQSLLTDPTYRQKAEATAATLKQEDGLKSAVAQVIAFE